MCERRFLGGRKHVYDENTPMKFLKSDFVREGFCPTLSAYDRSWNGSKIPGTGNCVLHEQIVYAAHEAGAERKMMTSVQLIRGESGKKKRDK